MANRNNVYIGNRYVPVFADPVEWDNLRIYEPLTIVTYQGTSYTSKKAVPAGIALSNTEYWVATGNYNAQVEQYRQDVEQYRQDVVEVEENLQNLDTEVNARIDALDDKFIIVIGDSYAHANDGTITKFYPEVMRDNLQIPAAKFKWSGNDGAGFGNGRYLTQLQTIYNSLSADERAAVTDVVVCGGWNDTRINLPEGTDEAFAQGIADFNTFIKTNLSKAKVSLGVISWSSPLITNNDENYTLIKRAIKRYSSACAKYGWRYLLNTVYILHDYTPSIWQNDGYHPKQPGQNLLGEYLAEAFVSGHCDILREEIVEVGNYMFSTFLHNDECILSIAPKNYSSIPFISLDSVTVNTLGMAATNLLDVSSLHLCQPAGYRSQMSGSGMLATSGGARIHSAFTFACSNHIMQGWFIAATTESTLANVTVVGWSGGTFNFNTLEC